MKTLRALRMRVYGVFGSSKSERELSAEIESHLQLHVDDNIRAGMTPAEARRRAVIALGGVERTKEAYRDRRGIPWFESLMRDLRYGIRTLTKSPGFAIAGIVILGLGIGVNTAIFTVVNAVVLKPLPFPEADRIVRLWHTPPQSTFAGMEIFALAPGNFLDWEAQSHSFEQMAIYRGGRWTLTGQGEPDAVFVLRGSADLLPILGVQPLLGRGFTKEEDREGATPTALLTNAFWRSRFGGDQNVIGKVITLQGRQYTVAGVVPDLPAFAQEAQVFVPLLWTPRERAERANHNYRGIAKLKPGATIAGANADLTAISERLAQQYPEDNKDWGALVRPLQDDMIGGVRNSLMVLLGAVALVLLIACANLANLMLVRTHGRAKEIAVRGALGASRLRVVQQLLAEGIVLGIGGGLVGFAAAYFGVDILKAAFGTALPRANEIVVDTQVLAFTAAIAVAAGLIAAFAPAWQLTGRDASEALRIGPGRGNSSSGDGRVRNVLVISEVALALMLLIGAGLLMRSLATLRGVDPGFDASNTWTGTITIPNAKYNTPEARNQFFARVLESVRALPGVQSAARIDTIPFGGGSIQYVTYDGLPAMKDSELPTVQVRTASPNYFATSKIRFVSGRDFTDADAFGKPRVVIVSEKAAAKFFPNQNPLGRHITLKMMTPEPAEIVGVVREVKMDALDASAESDATVYAPAAQFGDGDATLVVRTAGEPTLLTRSVINAVRAIDPEQPVLDIKTMEEAVEDSLGQRPLAMLLLGAFASLALILATVGIYSVLAYTVRQRVREIGIRMALGAPVKGLLRMIVIEGLKPTLIGVFLGLVMAAALVRVMESLLFGVSQYDPRTFSIVAMLMLAVGVIATLVPAYRATRVDPIVTLRSE
ncbi:MAG TPA: ABC transporter permease [Vicinamibacterales bacterium]